VVARVGYIREKRTTTVVSEEVWGEGDYNAFSLPLPYLFLAPLLQPLPVERLVVDL
jgi:hypothetical protein